MVKKCKAGSRRKNGRCVRSRPQNIMICKNSRIGFGGFLLFLNLLFIALKLSGVIAWSWFWVLSPLIFFVIAIIIIMMILAIMLRRKR